MNKQRAKTISYHIICAALILTSLYFTVFHSRAVLMRVWQACKDLGRSCVYYVMGYADKHEQVYVSVNKVPSGMTTLLPVSVSELKDVLRRMGILLKQEAHYRNYFAFIGWIFKKIGLFGLMSFLPLVITVLLVWVFYLFVDNEHGKSTKPLHVWYKIEDIVIYPPCRYIKGLWEFLRTRAKYYLIAGVLVWGLNLNLLTILIEALAWILWLPFSLGFGNIFVQIAKLAVDLTVIFQVLPTWLLILIGYKLFDLYRWHVGLERLRSDEEENEKFLEENPGNMLATGKPRVGKTMAITDMGLTENVRFRKMAKSASFKRRMEFPFFPWSVLEQLIFSLREKRRDFGLPLIRDVFIRLEELFVRRDELEERERVGAAEWLKELGYQSEDFIFGYNYKRHGLTYDNNLTIVSVWESIELYAEEFAIYTSPKPLLIGNFPIRTCIRWKTKGNYPKMKADFFKIKPCELMKATEWNHIVPMDAMRLGVKYDPKGAYNDSLDYGCFVFSELGKEIGNQITNRGKGNEIDAANCNPNNDLWTMNAKMMSHAMTIDYDCYARILADEQRAGSVLADFRELGYEMQILKKHKEKIRMPFFAFEELAYVLSRGLMEKILDFFNYRHGKMTLFLYAALRIFQLINNHYVRVYNEFASYRIDIRIKDDSQGETKQEGKLLKYRISRKKTCADIYDTGYFKTFYYEKQKRSKVGGTENIPQFTGKTPTIPQMIFMKSHTNKRVFKYFDVNTTDETDLNDRGTGA